MGPEKEIERMRAGLSGLSKGHPRLGKLFRMANDELWALELALEEEEVDRDDVEE